MKKQKQKHTRNAFPWNRLFAIVTALVLFPMGFYLGTHLIDLDSHPVDQPVNVYDDLLNNLPTKPGDQVFLRYIAGGHMAIIVYRDKDPCFPMKDETGIHKFCGTKDGVQPFNN